MRTPLKSITSKVLIAAALLVVAGSYTPSQAQQIPYVGSSNVPGSFLVFPMFDIRSGRSTQLRIVNNHWRDIDVKLNYVCPGIKHVNEFCATVDRQVSLTGYETEIIDVASHNPPCQQGYAVGFAKRHGRAISYNYLTGSYNIREGERLEADNAYVMRSVMQEDEENHDQEKVQFGPTENPGQGQDAVSLARSLYVDFRAIGGDQEGSRLTLLDLNILAGMQNPPAVVFIDFWNAAEEPFSTSHEFICWSQVQLDSIDANFREVNLGTTYGSMKIEPFPNCPVPGACPPLIPHYPAIMGALEEYGNGTRAVRSVLEDNVARSAVYQPR